jgi:N-methylhydantoinase A
MGWRVGADIGGTFIDFCALETQTGRLESLKVLTTPEEPGRELMDGFALLEERYGVEPAKVGAFVHGTTIGINTVIQRKGARLALVTTAGFEDVIELARLRMPDMYSLFCSRPEPLISRDLVFGIPERVLADGCEQLVLDEPALTAALDKIRRKGAQGIIVAFLHAYRNPAHEARAKEVLQALAPELFVFTSSEVWPVIREYERTSTTIINGYVHPRVASYLESLEAGLRGRGVPAQPMITKSNGGVMDAAIGRSACVSMLLSGTAAGVMGASYLAKNAGVGNALTLDIGGTSADLALIIEGEPQFGTGEMVGEFPLFVPSVSVTSIGSGGGSIAWVDEFGVLRVGPESAGSTPGPACYGRGGERATITDAMAVCGFLGHAALAYDSIAMDIARAEAVIAEVAMKLGRSSRETAEAIVHVAISEMFAEVNKLIARYGVDLRDFTLLPFGGAGPMLGCLLARELGIARIMVPHRPGVVSALGGLIADIKSDFIRTVFLPAEPCSSSALRASFAELEAQAETWLRKEHGFEGASVVNLSAEMRYQGQSFEIEVPLEKSWVESGDFAAITDAFHRRHAAIYEFSDESAEMQIVNLRLVILGATTPPPLIEAPRAAGSAVPERLVHVWIEGASRQVPLYLRSRLSHGHEIEGPAIIVQDDTTVCVPSAFVGSVDAHLNLHLALEEDA